MKKITLLILMFVVSLGYSQEVMVLQDFENGGLGEPFGNLASQMIVADPADGGTRGMVAELITSAAGNVWQGTNLELNQNVLLNNADQLTMIVDVYSTTAISIAVKVIGSIDGGPDSTTQVDHAGNGWQSLIATFNTGQDGSGVANGTYTGFVVYPLWDPTTGTFINPAIERTVYIDNIAGFVGEDAPSGNPPTSTAPIPPNRPSADVFSVYSNAYTAETSELGAFGGGAAEDFNIEGDDFIGLSGAPGANLQWFFGIPAGVDLSSFSHYHMDFYFEGEVPGEGAIFQTIIQGFDGSSAFTGNTLHNVTPTVTGQWLSLDIPISTFNGGVSVRDNIGQMQLVMAGPAFGPTYIDNVYFHKNTLGTEDFDRTTFRAFPNPTNGDWNISASTVINKIAVYDILGKQVVSLAPNANEAVIDASSLNSGIYFAKIEGNNGSKTVKLIKK